MEFQLLPTDNNTLIKNHHNLTSQNTLNKSNATIIRRTSAQEKQTRRDCIEQAPSDRWSTYSVILETGRDFCAVRVRSIVRIVCLWGSPCSLLFRWRFGFWRLVFSMKQNWIHRGNDAARGYGDLSQKCVQFLVIPNGQLDMSGANSRFTGISSLVSCQI